VSDQKIKEKMLDRKKVAVLILLMSSILGMVACEKLMPPAPADEDILAGTIPGLSPQQEREHLIGDELFGKFFTKEEGLGPIFLQTSCSNCHIGNGKGHISTLLTRFAKMENGQVDYLFSNGGPQLQDKSIGGYPAEVFPSEANIFSKRLPPIVMGLGYISALTDEAILANVDSLDANGDGISGRPNYVSPKDYFKPEQFHIANNGKYIGRFGKKAEKITVLDQVVFALKQDIGITSDFDMEDLYNSQAGNNTGDETPDPEVSANVVHSLVFYMRTLKAPKRRNLDDPDAIQGENLFNQIGCTSCHKPSFTTGKSDIEALSYQTFHPYSDFLLHDMGQSLDDGYPEGSAKGSEWRTPPLWGLGLAKDSQGGAMFLLHDGRASSIEDVLISHGGEAASRRTAFFNLPESQRSKIIKFLESL
jgi:CxxC motif-containing protein (DUF1111 family)